MVDLHVHSVFSDGTLTPAELVALARETGVTAIALCDHNTVAGLPSFLDAAEGSGVRAVPGVEFSTEYRGRELHILGLFIRPEDHAAVTALLTEGVALLIVHWRLERIADEDCAPWLEEIPRED